MSKKAAEEPAPESKGPVFKKSPKKIAKKPFN
jgi:hypothetical protein